MQVGKAYIHVYGSVRPPPNTNPGWRGRRRGGRRDLQQFRIKYGGGGEGGGGGLRHGVSVRRGGGGSKAMHAVRYTEERKEKGKKKSRKEGRDRSVEAIGEEERKAFLFGCLASHLRGK